MADLRFCRKNCVMLKPQEKDQTSAKESHICQMLQTEVKHEGFHPNLVRLEGCRW